MFALFKSPAPLLFLVSQNHWLGHPTQIVILQSSPQTRQSPQSQCPSYSLVTLLHQSQTNLTATLAPQSPVYIQKNQHQLATSP